jgi:hypothetical protein
MGYCSTVVENLTHNPEINGLNLVAGTGREKMVEKSFITWATVAQW